MNCGYEYTEKGLAKVNEFIAECWAYRKELLDAGKDTADDTNIPTADDILWEIDFNIDCDGDYYNCWGVTDNYDLFIGLTLGEDIVEV